LAPGQFAPPPMVYPDTSASYPPDWSLRLELRGDSLKRFNPVPHLLQSLQRIEGLRPLAGALYSVLTELYANALEHGVLGLDSGLKCDADGFARYYSERDRRLALQVGGFVCIEFKVEPHDGGGRLSIEVRDSGDGFNVDRVLSQVAGSHGFSGRGLQLVQRLSQRARWLDSGRCARVEFAWTAQA
ncbi:MAG TPA: ATP-binding protein, partial [Pseudomonas sp.]|uniref:ATP-binding protein n=1 Tax=Pseudomonas sp. TaxID=306 RepID=UPI002B49F9E8